MKKVLSIIALAAVSMTAAAQDKVEVTGGADVVSEYIWRGQDLGHAAIQPTLGLSYKGLSLTAWGSTGIADAADTREFDLTLGYTVGGLNIGITDYWFNAGLDPRNRYFMYNSHSTNHVFEANVGYDFGALSLQWYTNIAGNDGCNKDGERAYSSYVEMCAPFSLASLDWEATVGAVPFATSFYGNDGLAVTNIGVKATKPLTINEHLDLPVFAAIEANPCAQTAYFTVGVSVQLK